MSTYILLPQINLLVSLGGLALLVATIALTFDLLIYKGKYFGEVVRANFWTAVTAVTIGSVALSLLYSEYFGFIPCSLCWLQRIAIYPQALLSVMAYRTKDVTQFPRYGIGLSIFGLLVAIYQYLYQMLPKDAGSGLLPCLVDGSNADCATKVIDQFGFVTFPFLSAVTFAFLIVIYLYILRTRE